MIDINIKSKEFGIEVNKKLIELDIQKKELSEKLGIGNTYLYDILKNNRKAYEIRERIIQIIKEWEGSCTADVNK